jgi:N-acetylglucosaminyldiphosphoundecaprenol N-acetyl-beta-D-mannosaminyltransferase
MALGEKVRLRESDIRTDFGSVGSFLREALMSDALQRNTTVGHCGGARAAIAPDFSRPAFCVQGLIFDVLTIEQAMQRIMTSIKEGRRCNMVTPNANFLRMIRSDPDFRDAVLASDLSVIDGMPLVWFARALGIAVPYRLGGSDLFDALMRNTSGQIGTFFFGGTRDIGRRVRKHLDESTSGVRCNGVYSPGFGSVESMSDGKIFHIINRTGSDLLVVSVGARKGLLWLNRNEHLLSIPVMCNLGATINFVAGSVKRAPAFFRRHGLEWLWRIKEEPGLWTRYARDLATLISVLVGQILPCVVYRALHQPLRMRSPSRRFQYYHEPSGEVLKFSGVWTKDDLAPVRECLTAATRRTSNLVIDLEGVTFVDAAFLGQILLAYGYQRRTHQGFLLRASSGPIKTMLRLHGCGFLLLDRQKDLEADSLPSRPVPPNSEGTRKFWERTTAFRSALWTNSHGR